ncbi:hypothetical protein AgCh_009706 [Apium graveolens]
MHKLTSREETMMNLSDQNGGSNSVKLPQVTAVKFRRMTAVIPDTEPKNPVYSLLSHPVHENLVSTIVEISDRNGIVPDKILHEILRNGDAAQKYNQELKIKMIDNWILLDNVDKGSGAYDRAPIKALNKNFKRSKKHMSMKQHKIFGSLALPDDSSNCEICKPMHDMWKGIISLHNVFSGQTCMVQVLWLFRVK